MGAVLQRGTQAIIDRLAACIDAGRGDGSVPPGMPARVLAEALYQLWLGASLLVKVDRSGEPFGTAMLTTAKLLD